MPEPAGIYGLVLFLAMVFFSGPKMLADADTYWHIKVGQTILESGHILTKDIFSHTAYGTQWIAHEWLTEICMAWLADHFGLAGLAIVGFLLVALTFNLLFQINRELSNDWAALASLAIAGPLAYSHLLARPHIVSWLFGVMTLYLLLRGGRWLWGLPLLTLIWANFHGSVLLCVIFQGIFWLGALLDQWPGRSRTAWDRWWSESRARFYLLALSILLIGLNPFGYQLLWFPFHVSAEIFVRNINEWMPPNLQSMWHLRVWIILLLLFAARYWRQTRWAWRLLIVLLLFQALGHIRYVSIAAIYLSPWMAMVLKDLFTNVKLPIKPPTHPSQELALSPITGPVLTVLACALLLWGIHVNPDLLQNQDSQRFPMPEAYSQEVVDFLKGGYPHGNLLNEYSWGGYLIYALDNPPKVFIDGRADMYGEHIFRNYITMKNIELEMEFLMKQYKIGWVLFPSDHILIRYLLQTDDWQVLFKNDQVSIIKRIKAE